MGAAACACAGCGGRSAGFAFDYLTLGPPEDDTASASSVPTLNTRLGTKQSLCGIDIDSNNEEIMPRNIGALEELLKRNGIDPINLMHAKDTMDHLDLLEEITFDKCELRYGRNDETGERILFRDVRIVTASISVETSEGRRYLMQKHAKGIRQCAAKLTTFSNSNQELRPLLKRELNLSEEWQKVNLKHCDPMPVPPVHEKVGKKNKYLGLRTRYNHEMYRIEIDANAPDVDKIGLPRGVDFEPRRSETIQTKNGRGRGPRRTPSCLIFKAF